MSRPAFLDNVHSLRTRSTASDPVREAYAIERSTSSPWKLSELVFCVVVAALGVLGYFVSAGG
jgi:hypothetical protein